ncbi:accessory Sec system S-layer assembly protein [Halobacillus litoralis]|uniref:accessory Sec system S-layer assembly protein n=1 Tax=Halobacillus litoralis TaxID=45668 RepID=UPI002493B325|nr:accessory Sec system S-layer assembly protein [Halobacillus litoralis]
MFNFLKKKEADDHVQYDESGIDAGELVDKERLSENKDEEVFTDLSIHPEWQLPEEEVYVYRFLNNDLPPLRPNQVSVHGVEIKPKDGGLVVESFVRNSLAKGIQLKPAAILVLDKQGETVARKNFDLNAVGTIPGRSSRPWSFLFPPSSIINKEGEIPVHGWRLAIELKKKPAKHKLDLEESWSETLESEEVEKLDRFVDSITPPKPGEMNFLSLEAKQVDTGDLHVTLLLRNGSDRDLAMKHLSLRVEDASGEVAAEGGFKLKDLEVKANTSKPWTFIFPPKSIKKDELDLSKWKAYPLQK